MDSKLGNEAMQFNQYVKSQGLNNIVDKNTKIVYISNNKIPKPLMKSGFRPKGMTKKVALSKAEEIAPDECWIKNKRCKKPHDGMVDAFLIARYLWELEKN